jgi:L-alanine-DL-glutamate epimerase-like enolase superfamily enzyme
MPEPTIDAATAIACRIPTDAPESDGTYAWDSTTIVIAEIRAGDTIGFGYTYGTAATVPLIRHVLADRLRGQSPFDIARLWSMMMRELRNIGQPGIGTMAVSALDVALWDLKAKLLGLPTAQLLGRVRDTVPLYASGGFTSYSPEQLQRQLRDWTNAQFRFVKMKVGREPQKDEARVRIAREAIGSDVELFVDANGAYTRKQALAFADIFARYDVRWFEEPVSSDDVEGLRLLRDRAPPGMVIAAGEYGYRLDDFQRLLAGGAVDVLQADGTRCGGITGLLRVDALCSAFQVPLSLHTAPMLHLHVACALSSLAHLEYFYDHARVEQLLFEGVVPPRDGQLRPELAQPGLGIALDADTVRRYALETTP